MDDLKKKKEEAAATKRCSFPWPFMRPTYEALYFSGLLLAEHFQEPRNGGAIKQHFFKKPKGMCQVNY